MDASHDFPTETAGLPRADETRTVELQNGERIELRITPVAKRLGDTVVRMLAYNGSIPGPTLRVRQGSELVVHVVNQGDLEATVHWHGLRLDNEFDGTHETQPPIPVGGEFTYRLRFPDPGVYWYHPHIREDYGQELGLYGNIVVVPEEADYWPPVHREVALALDDVLIEDGKIAPFLREGVTHTAMGRFGNVLLANGDPAPSLAARRGEVVRFYLTNTANTRVFNVGLSGGRLKLVGGDSGHREGEEFVESVLLGPSERAVVDVRFEVPGPCVLEHRTPKRTYSMATIVVTDEPADPPIAGFERLRTLPDLTAERERIAPYLHADPDKTLALVATMDMGTPEVAPYSCPMHPDVVRDEPGRCPKCGMKLLGTAPQVFVCPMHPEVKSERPDRCPKCGMKLVSAQLVEQKTGHGNEAHGHHHGHGHGHGHPDTHASRSAASDKFPEGIEWEDDMVDVNRMTTPANTRWKLVDRATGAEGGAITWRFRVGDRVKIRLVNEMDSDHPMHHPFHVHGAGRFLILARDGAPEPVLCWKDTVLIPTGQTVDILLDVTNPGRWMAHCHISEHHESGMMLSFDVEP
jgi:FtsP/CotA-like multicopper oxidase with cupredoxin domain